MAGSEEWVEVVGRAITRRRFLTKLGAAVLGMATAWIQGSEYAGLCSKSKLWKRMLSPLSPPWFCIRVFAQLRSSPAISDQVVLVLCG
jgi:hypothetical protein